MKFYDREHELSVLETIYGQCTADYGKITVITGRRRVGKTMLALEYARDKPSLYLFAGKKAESLLCQEFVAAYEELTHKKPIGELNRFVHLFELLLEYGKDNPFVLIIDEFQEFFTINKSVYSDIQRLWDRYKFSTKIHVVFIGSVYSLMTKIFQDEKEPLYGRADRVLYIRPFQARVIRTILKDYGELNNENLFFNYLVTGGVPRYEELLIQNRCFDKTSILDFIFEKDSFFIAEGKSLLIQEFGKEYGIYFSILELLSQGRTSRTQIESVLEKSVGGYLEKLETQYDLIEKIKPMGDRKQSRNQKFAIKDNFIRFWFRFVNRNMSMIENQRFDYVKRLIERDLPTFAGPVLEKLFMEVTGYSSRYGLIGNYWEKGNLNEIDLVAVNDFEKEVLVAEVKMNPKNIKLRQLKDKTERLHKRYDGYTFTYRGLSLEDVDGFMEEMRGQDQRPG